MLELQYTTWGHSFLTVVHKQASCNYLYINSLGNIYLDFFQMEDESTSNDLSCHVE